MSFDKMDAVLPITIRDYERFTILDKSLKMFCHAIRNCWIVTPDQEFEQLKSWIQDDTYQVIAESSLIPEFKIFNKTRGWYKQQLIKIAIAEKIETDFYLTLDADVICTKSVFFSDLVKEGRAVCYILEKDLWPSWYKWAEQVLVLKASRLGVVHNVTPAVLSKPAMLKLHEYLSHLSHTVNLSLKKRYLKLFILKLLSKTIIRDIVDWRIYLLTYLPWTEYSLYYTFLEKMNLFDKYHVRVEHSIYSHNSVWYRDQFSSWNPEQSFDRADNSFFTVVQSNTGISADQVWEKVSAYLK
jgi:Family of unknown function (DUF6492)